jgi:hypothetical protein
MSSPSITSIVTESNSFRVDFVAGSPPAGAHTNSVTLFVNEKGNSDSAFPIYTIFESSIAAEDDIPASFLIELEVPPQFNVGATYVMSVSQSFSDGSETVSNTREKDYVLNAKPLKPVVSAVSVAEGDQVVSFYLNTGASQGSAVLSISGRSFNVAAGQYVTHQCPINASTLTRAGSSGTNMKVRKTIVGDPQHGDNLYYCVLLNLENGVHYEHRFSTINAVGKSESCDVFTSTPANEVLAVTGFALDSSIKDYRFTAAWNALTIPNHDDFESIVTGYKLEYEYTDASYNAVTATFDASSNVLADQSGGRLILGGNTTAPSGPVVPIMQPNSSSIIQPNSSSTTTFGFISDPLQVAEAASGVSIVNGIATTQTSSAMTTSKGTSNPALITAEPDQDGWTINNAGGVADASGNYPKVSLYFYGNTVAAASQTASNSFTLNDATGLGLYAIFDQAAGAKEYPYFNAYTTPSGSVNKASWYKSRVFYGAQSNSGDTVADPDNVGLTLAYTGTDNPAIFPHIVRRVKYEVKVGTDLTNAYDEYASELVNSLTLQTSQQAVSAGNYNFRLLEAGMFTSHASFGQLRLLYNLTGKVAATIYATTDNSGDGALSAVQSIRVFDTPMGLRPQDYTITAHDQEIRVNIQLNAATLAYLSNRSTLTHIVVGLMDASYNPIVDASYNPIHASSNVLQDASGNNTLNLNHTFTGLTNGTTYTVPLQLVALNPNPLESEEVIYGEAVYEQNIVPVATGDAISVTATGSDQKVTFNWFQPTQEQLQGGAFVKYVIKYRGSSGNALIHEETDINATSYVLTGLTNGTTYYFTFYMVTLDLNTGLPVNGDATDLEQIPFRKADAPTEIELYPGDEQMLVDWPEAVFNGSTPDYYVVELFSGEVGSDTFVTSVQVSSTSYTFPALTNGTSYYATVTAITTNPNDVNDQRQGGTITSSSKIPFRAPDAPNSVVLTAGDRQMQVNWSTAVLNGSNFREYLVELFSGGDQYGATLSNQNTLYHTFYNLRNDSSYYARVTVYATDPNDSSIVISGFNTQSDSQIAFGETPPPTLAYYPGYQTLRVVWSDVNRNGGRFHEYKVRLYERLSVDASGNNVLSSLLSEAKYSNFYQNTHTFTNLTIGVNYVVKVIVVTSDPNGAEPAAGGDAIDSPAGSITAKPHDNPIIIGSATINDSTKTVSVTVDKNGSEITDYMAIVQPGNYMQKINDSSFSNGTLFTLSMVFDTSILDASGNSIYPALLYNPISSALMVVGNGRGFTAVEFNGSTQTVLSPEHYRALP